MGLLSIVLTPFVGVRNLFSIGYYGWPVEALSKRVFDQGSRRGMVTAVDITQQSLPMFDGNAAL